MSKTKVYWQGLDALHSTAEHQESAQNEFPEHVPVDKFLGDENLGKSSTQRRDFLKYMGFSIGAATLAACETPVLKTVPYLNKPESITPGVPNYYATTFYDGHDYCPIMVKTREGRPIHIAGNKAAEFAGGGVNARVNSSVLSLYDSNRAQDPFKNGEKSDWNTIDGDIVGQLEDIATNGGAIRILTSSIISPTEKKAISEFKAKYGNVEVVSYDAVSYSGILDANKATFGKRVMPDLRFEKADVVVSVGADFLNGWFNSVVNMGRYGKKRNPNGKMSKHYQFETTMSLSGSNCDVRTAIKPSEIGNILLALYKELGGNVAGSTGEYDATVKAAAASLKAAKGKSIVICGSNSVADQMIVNAINETLNNIGSTIIVDAGWNTKQGSDAKVNALIDEMNAGSVDALFVSGCNPSYSLSRSDDFNTGLAKVGLTVSFAMSMDETASGCKYLCPTHHYLESWGDMMPVDGQFTTCQPTIQPLYNTRQHQESFLKWAGNDADYYSYLKDNWATSVFPGLAGGELSADRFFNTTLFNGFVATNAVSSEIEVNVESDEEVLERTPAMDVSASVSEISARKGGTWELQLYEKASMGNGNQANNPWLQELPDPISRVTWDNYVTMCIADMKDLGLSRLERGDYEADMVTVTSNGKSVTLPVYISPGQRRGTIGIALGYGRTAAGKCGDGVGQNGFALANGDQLSVFDITVSGATGEKYEIGSVQTHHTLMGRDEIVKEATLEEYGHDKKAGNPDILLYVSSGKPSWAGGEEAHSNDHGADAHGEEHAEGGEGEHGGSHGEKLDTKTVNIWADHPVEDIGHRWGMTIDLNTCLGCGSCVTACSSENNVPVVGKEEVRRSRDMHWIRIDRYYSSDMTQEFADDNDISAIDKFTAMEEAADLPQVAFQPIMCQHCNHAPCETVCPVAATNHSNEGLNQMVYNRCIGTRYCANNCPYKVRRFNWFQYHGGRLDFATNPANDPMGRMVLNPDVVVRDRGVMEKCSFCIQRIQAVKLKSKKEGHKVADMDMEVACSEACPTNAIRFGDVNDSESEVHQGFKEERSYALLEEVGVQPNVVYKTMIRNV